MLTRCLKQLSAVKEVSLVEVKEKENHSRLYKIMLYAGHDITNT